MTARRRRRSGTGPSATALIAWVGGVPETDTPPASADQPENSGRRRAVTRGARGIMAGTLLACGSVLAIGGNAADSPLTDSAQPPEKAFPDPEPGPVGGSAVSAVSAGYTPTSERAAPPPAGPSFADPGTSLGGDRVRAGEVHRNSPQNVTVPPSTTTPAPPAAAEPDAGAGGKGPVGAVTDGVIDTINGISGPGNRSSTGPGAQDGDAAPEDPVGGQADPTGQDLGTGADQPGDQGPLGPVSGLLDGVTDLLSNVTGPVHDLTSPGTRGS